MFIFIVTITSLVGLMLWSFLSNTSGMYWRIGFNTDMFFFSIKIDYFYKYIVLLYFVFLLNIAVAFVYFYSDEYKREFFKREDVMRFNKMYLIYIMYISTLFRPIFISVLFLICTIQVDMLLITIIFQTVFVLAYCVFHLKHKKYDSNEYGKILRTFDLDS